MREIDANSGVFVNENKEKLLLVIRNKDRRINPGKPDLVGGNLLPGEIPEEVLIQDFADKLNIHSLTILESLVIISEEVDATIRRHVFICTGDYSSLKVDPKKYNRADWVDIDNIPYDNLTLHAQNVVRAIKPHLYTKYK